MVYQIKTLENVNKNHSLLYFSESQLLGMVLDMFHHLNDDPLGGLNNLHFMYLFTKLLYKLVFNLCLCMTAMCLNMKTRRGHQSTWSWSYRWQEAT